MVWWQPRGRRPVSLWECSKLDTSIASILLPPLDPQTSRGNHSPVAFSKVNQRFHVRMSR
nr:MAG TPA: hypothetical protein [Caudoviricetes sp.]